MAEVPQQGSAYTEAEPGGVQGAINRQIGPLKAWQWGVVIGGAILLYRVVKGGNSGSSSVVVGAPNSGDVSGGPTNDNTVSNITNAVQLPTITKTLVYYRGVITRKANVYDRAGKITGYFAAGRSLILGTKVNLNGTWYYTILNMPGKYVKASTVSVTPIYNESIKPTIKTAATAVSTSIAAPTSTPESTLSILGLDNSAVPVYQPSATVPFYTGTVATPTIQSPSTTSK